MAHLSKHLFVDLERTLIDTWGTNTLGPKHRVVELLAEHFEHSRHNRPLDATVWSFAIWDDRDRIIFNTETKFWLEDEFNLNFVDVITVKEMIDAVCELKGFNLQKIDLWDFCPMWGKDRSLEDWIKLKAREFANKHIVLLDDMVGNRTVNIHDTNTRIDFVKV